MPGLNLRGDITNNILVGSDENDTLVGRRGLDTVIGLSGDDLIWGNDDDDRLFGNAGKDTLYGGKNNDTLEGGQGDDRLLGNQGHDVILGNDGNDVVLGGGGSDLVFGGVGDDSLFGNSGNDVLFGGQGNDAIYGGKGNDHIEGDKGDDTIYGDVGADTITGGDGRDVIVLEESSRVALDTITDFQPSEDAVRLPDGTTYAELVFESDGAGGTVVRDGRSGKALLVLPGVSSTTLTPDNFQSSNTQSTPDSGAPQPPATETPQENEDTPDIPVTENEPEPDTPVDNTEPEPETPAENPALETPPTNNTPDPVPNTPPPADPPPDPIPENQPPIAIDDIATTEFNTAIEISVLNNDIDPDGDALTVTVDEESASNGTVTTDGTTVTYTPNADFTGIDRMTYTVSDGTDSDTGSIEITVIPSEIRWIGGGPTDPTNWSNPNNWEFGIVPTENQDVLISASAIYQPILTEDVVARNVLVEAGANINVADFILGSFGNVDAHGSIVASEYNYDAGVRVEGNDVTVQGTLPNLFVRPTVPSDTANVRVVGETTINGNLNLEVRGYEWSDRPVFALNGQKVTVLGRFSDTGRSENLVMDDINDTFNVNELYLRMSHISESRLTAGVLNIFASHDSHYYSPNRWIQASDLHKIVFKGDRRQALEGYLQDVHPIFEQQNFQNWEIDNPYGVSFNDIFLTGTLTLTNGEVSGERVYIGGNLVNVIDRNPDPGQTVWRVEETIAFGGNIIFPERLSTRLQVIGDTTFKSSFSLRDELIIGGSARVPGYGDEDGAQLRLGGNEVSVFNLRTYGDGGLIMDDPNDVLIVEHDFNLDNPQASQLTNGVLKLRTRWPFQGYPFDFFEASGSHTVVFEGNDYQDISELKNPGPNPGQSHFQNVEIDNDTVVTFDNGTYINGNVTLTNGIVKSNYNNLSGGITLGGDLIDNTGRGNAWQAEMTTFTSANPQLPRELETTARFVNHTTLSNNFDLRGELVLEAGGDLTVDSYISIDRGVTVFLGDGFDGIDGSGDIETRDMLYITDLDTTATIPEFRSNPIFRFPDTERLLIRVDDGGFNPGRELRHGAITDVHFGDSLEIVTHDGTITLNNFNGFDALTDPETVTLTTGSSQGPSYQTYEGGSLLARNDEGNLWGSWFGDRIIGKAEAQIIDGSDGEDIISGGAGADILTGGNHLDIFAYDNPSEGGDTITDFSASQEDKIQFSRENFGNPTIEFNVAAASTDQATVYATPLSGGTQQVMFDSDGNGAAQPVHLATLTNLSVGLEDGDIYGYGAYPFHSSTR